MRAKKLLTVSLSVAMIMTPMSVGATTQSANQVEITDAASANTAITLNVSSDTLAVSKNQYKVVLPTNKALDFVLDPQGLLALDTINGGKGSLAELEADAGLVRPASTSINAAIQNKSSMPITVSVDFVSNMGSGIVAVASANDVEKDTKANILLGVAPSKVDTMNEAYEPTAKSIQIGNGANKKLEFYLAGGNWDVSKNGTSYTAEYADGGSGTAFTLTGLVNRRADWASVTGKPNVTATFKFDKASDTEPAYDSKTGAFALVSSNTIDAQSMATLGTSKKGVVKILNGEGLKNEEGDYPAEKLLYVQKSTAIDTSVIATKATLTAADATYDGAKVNEMTPAQYDWNPKTGKLDVKSEIVTALHGEKAHLAFFIVFQDGSVLQTKDVAF